MSTSEAAPADLEYPSLHAALATFGVHSKRNPNRRHGGRVLYRSGEVLGTYHCAGGWALVAELEADAA